MLRAARGPRAAASASWARASAPARGGGGGGGEELPLPPTAVEGLRAHLLPPVGSLEHRAAEALDAATTLYRQRPPATTLSTEQPGSRHDFLGNLIDRGRTAVLLSGDAVVGACTWAPHVAAGLAEVWLLAIRRSHARKGLGSLLLRAVEARLLADGVRCAVACAGHDTVPFWRRVGYASDGTLSPKAWSLVLDPFGNSALVMKRLGDPASGLYLDGV